MSRLTNDPEMAELIGIAPRSMESPVEGSVLLPSAGDNPMMGGAYEGASRFDNEVALWSPSMGSADSDILGDKPLLDARTRDALRNDSYVAAGSNLHKDNIVGSMFLLNAKPEAKVLGLDETWADEFQEEVEAKFTLWAESIRNWPDAARINTFTGLVRLAVGVYVMAGEVLASAEWLSKAGHPAQTAIQMIDLDRLSDPPKVFARNDVRGGVHRDKYGAPIGYYIRTNHPSDWVHEYRPDEWKYVKTRKRWGRMQMIHIYDQQRPDQSRGISEMVSALKELRITKRFRDIVLQNAVVNATYAASIESELPTEQVFASLGGASITEAAASKAINSYAAGYLSSIAAYSGKSNNLKLDGVRIPHLFPGTKLQLRPAGQGGPLGTEFEQSLLRYIAANLGVSYEQLSRDYSQTNYSSSRAASTETWKTMRARKRMVADRFATHIYMLWLEEMIEKREITSLPRRAPTFWEGINAEAYSNCEWIGASLGQVDELKETQAAVLRLRYNLSTYEEEHARLGRDWRKVFTQRERENTSMEEKGLVFGEEKDNMMNAVTGAPREKEASDEQKDGSEGNTDA